MQLVTSGVLNFDQASAFQKIRGPKIKDEVYVSGSGISLSATESGFGGSFSRETGNRSYGISYSRGYDSSTSGVILPEGSEIGIRYSNGSKNLDVTYKSFDLSRSHEVFKRALGEGGAGWVLENVKANFKGTATDLYRYTYKIKEAIADFNADFASISHREGFSGESKTDSHDIPPEFVDLEVKSTGFEEMALEADTVFPESTLIGDFYSGALELLDTSPALESEVEDAARVIALSKLLAYERGLSQAALTLDGLDREIALAAGAKIQGLIGNFLDSSKSFEEVTIEDLLGIPKGYKRPAPGTFKTDKEEYLYIEDDGSGKRFNKHQFWLITEETKNRRPTAGDMFNQRCRVTLPSPDNRIFHAISYSGDLEGWRLDIEEDTERRGLLLARVENYDTLVIDDGKSYKIADCKVEMDYKE